MIIIRTERYSDVIEELKPLYGEHYEALALNQDKVPLAPRYDLYESMDDAGKLLCVTMREEGRVVGYFLGVVDYALHYATCLTLQMDIFWITPSARKHFAGVKLFRAVLEEARRRGVDRVFFGSKSHANASALFEYLGMEKVETYYSLWIGE